MAEGGSKYSLSGGHEEFFEWQCKICEDDGKPKEATAYCTTCGDCFCSTCAKFHIKFTRNKHQVLGEKEKADWGRSESKGETGIFCSEHHGQQVSMYCAVHDNMCCTVCAVLKHSDSCKPQMSYIPDVAKGLKEGADYKAVITDNDNLISSITALAKVRTNLQAKLKASRDECTRRIETFHKKLAMHLHKLKEESIAEMNKSHDEMVQNVEEDIKACRKLEQELHDMKEQLSPSVSVNESILFVRMKNGQKRLPNYEDLITNLAALERKTFEFIQSDSYSKSVCSARTLGECIGVTQTPKKPHAPRPVMEAKDQCPICKGNINKPRTLDCGHKFCTGCIEKSFKCPTCGEVCGVLTVSRHTPPPTRTVDVPTPQLEPRPTHKPEPKLVDKAWRYILQRPEDWSEKANNDLKQNLKCRFGNTETVNKANILLLGPIKSGKSSFVNSILGVSKRRIVYRAYTGEADSSYTKRAGHYTDIALFKNFKLHDSMGVEPDDGEGLHISDVIYMLAGNIPKNYQFNPRSPISAKDPIFVSDPPAESKVHCVIFFADATTLMGELPQKTIQKIGQLQAIIRNTGIPRLLCLTKIDLLCDEVNDDLTKTFYSIKVQNAVNKASAIFNMPKPHIHPIKNYKEEVDTNVRVEMLLMYALGQALDFATDYLDRQEED